MVRKKTAKKPKKVETLTHDEEKRPNIPTAEYQSVMKKEEQHPIRVAYERRNPDLDPQLVWRGKDVQDWSELVVHAPPLYIQEKVHPKVLVDDLVASGQWLVGSGKQATGHEPQATQLNLFADFNGLPEGASKTDFYQHDANWSNRMILGDSLQVMASLAEREGLRGKVQCIYIDPPYGIKFNSNFQWSTTSRDVKDGKADHITREPEMVKAFRDTWKDGIHSYLTYLRDRLTVARDLLAESGSIFVQIGDENVHRVRGALDEVFGDGNLVSLIAFKKTSGTGSRYLENIYDYVLWYAKELDLMKYRPVFAEKPDELLETQYTNEDEWRATTKSGDTRFMAGDMSSQGASEAGTYSITHEGKEYRLPGNTHWKASREGMPRLAKAERLVGIGKRLRYRRYADDYPVVSFTNSWDDTIISGYSDPKVYVVQTTPKVVQRCLLMSTDPGDLVLDPTFGSWTSAFVAEQWGRRWITIDTSRVALALARARIMGARYPYYLLADSKEGQEKEANLTRSEPSEVQTYGKVRHGFVYERVPHITLKSIANNAEIDVIWEKYQESLESLRKELNTALEESWQEWEIPREEINSWPDNAKKLHGDWWKQRIARQKEIDASIEAKAEFEYLYDKPYEDKKTVRVAGPFTVESLSPHRVLTVGADDELIDPQKAASRESDGESDFVQMILENLKTAGVQQAHKEDKIEFTSLTPWPGHYICAEGRYVEGGREDGPQKRAGILVGPEFGTVSRPDLVAAAREAGDADFEVLIACAFNYDSHSSDFGKLGRLPILKARMNADLHMAEDLKNTGKGNLFVIFGEPDIAVVSGQWLVARNGRFVANYDCVKELSGIDSLAEINRLGGEDLSGFKELAAGRALRSDRPSAPGGGIGSVEHSGRSGTNGDGGVSPVSERGERVAGGSGDATDSVASVGATGGGGVRTAHGGSGGNREDAQRAKTLAALETLVAKDFPLSLTTNHQTQVTIHGVDVFHPNTGEVRSDGAEGIACWFIDTDYNEESFFVRHAYFLGANDPYKSLKTSLRAEINEDAWESLHSDTSRPFDKPSSGRIAVKVINHLGDEVMKVFRV